MHLRSFLRVVAPLITALLIPGFAHAETVDTLSSPTAASTSAAAPLTAQPDAASARAWLLAHFQPGACIVGDETEFVLAADEVLADPETPDVSLFIYTSQARTAAGHPAWVAWLGLDDEWFVVFLDSTSVE